MKKYNREKYTGIYGSWYAMKQRCDNSNNVGYQNYGGRGIIYDLYWKKFENFKNDMGASYKKGLTIERIDNNGNYEKSNCRWATRKEQSCNKRNNIILKHEGQKKMLTEWARESSIGYGTFRARYYSGMTLKEIFKNSL